MYWKFMKINKKK